MFSLGVTMYQLISGRYAFGCDGRTKTRITDK
jgi:serine/threonine protein kinase